MQLIHIRNPKYHLLKKIVINQCVIIHEIIKKRVCKTLKITVKISYFLSLLLLEFGFPDMLQQKIPEYGKAL